MLPLAPGGDDGHVGDEVLERQLEPDLVVALAGAAVADGVRALGLMAISARRLAIGGPRQGGAEQVVLVLRAGLHGRDDEVVHELVGDVLDVELARAGLERLLLQALQLVGLADVAGDGDDLAVIVVLLEPGDDDGGVKASAVGENDFLDVRFIHDTASNMRCCFWFMR